ncbi:MAG: YbaN family protein [Magnetococcales bacterium]|nr:YbaN family protein [Magnetococcales bacterium]
MKKGMVRIVYLLTGFVFLGLGALGALLPILPTTPFLILALACFAQSSQRFHRWLYNHHLFGPYLQNWSRYRVIPPIAKIFAMTSMVGSLLYILLFLETPIYLIALIALIMAYGAWFVLTKPSYTPRDGEKA